MSHRRHHGHGDDHGRRHHHDRHDEQHRALHRARLQYRLARRLRRTGDDVTALEELQRDLEQAAADVAARVNELRAKSSSSEPLT